MKAKRVLFQMGVLLATVFVMVVFAAPAPAAPKPAPITLKAMGFYPVKHPSSWPLETWIDRVNQRAKGELIIKYLGGPEVMGQADQANAVMSGVVDILYSSPSWFSKPARAPALDGINLIDNSVILAKDIRKKGIYEFLQPTFAKVGVYWFGMGSDYNPHRMGLNVRVKTLNEFKGLKIRTFPTVVPFVKALGAVPVAMPTGDVYTAMERGTVIGWITTFTGFVKVRHYDEVTKYVVNSPVMSGQTFFVANLNVWKGLPQHLRQLMLDVKIEMEQEEQPAYFKKMLTNEEKLARAAGVEFIDISPPGSFTELSLKVTWATMKKKDSVLAPQLEELLKKR